MPWERPATRHVAAGVHGPACGALRCLAMPPTQPTRRWTPGYRRLWSATATSAVGTGMTTAAIPLVAALRPDSEFLLGAVAAAGLLPGLLLSIPAGVAADRWDRRRIMIWADLVRAVAIAAAALVLATSTLPAVALAALAFVVGAGETLFITASQSTLPSLVADDALDEANGHLQAATDGGREFVGPPIGSWLFHLVKWAPFAGDAVTYAASAAILAGVPPTADAPASPSPASPSRASPAAPDGSAGHGDGIGPAWRFLRGHRTLTVLAGALVVLSMSGAAVLALLVLVVTERWGLDDAWFGVALTLVACGATLAGMLAGAVRRLLSARATMSLAVAVNAVSYLVIGAAGALAAIPALVAWGIAVTLGNITSVGIRQRAVPPALLGRVMGLFRAALGAGGVVGATLGGVLAGATTVGTVAVVAGAVQLPVAVVLLVALPHEPRRRSTARG